MSLDMRRNEENFAHDLDEALKRQFAGKRSATEISMSGGGVDWKCQAARGLRSCRVNCFGDDGPEYQVYFESESEKAAEGRSPAARLVATAVQNWLDGCTVQDLYHRYAFVDREKRRLNAIVAEASRLRPNLARRTTQEMRCVLGSYELRFCNEDRACRFRFYGKEGLPRIGFEWDSSPLLGLQTPQAERVAEALELWLCERAMPSVLIERFPEAKVGRLAGYYEEGRPIEGEFIESWNWIEEFFHRISSSLPAMAAVPPFIAQIRAAGLDRTLRAGQSMSALIVSRSRRHGLRAEQPRICLLFNERGLELHASWSGVDERLTSKSPDLTSQVLSFLSRLEAMEID